MQGHEKFKSDDDLRTVFADSRIDNWKAELPEASSAKQRVEKPIDYLWSQGGEDQNALVLFLSVLMDSIVAEDALRDTLYKLKRDLEEELKKRFQAKFEEAIRREHRNVTGAKKQLKESWDRIFEHRKESTAKSPI